MESRNRVSFCTTEMQHSWDKVKGRGSISGVSLAAVDSESSEDRGHSVVRLRRIRSLKCWEEETGLLEEETTNKPLYIITYYRNYQSGLHLGAPDTPEIAVVKL